MDVINRKLGNTLKLPEGHLRMFLLGNLGSGHWMKMMETAPPSSIVDGLRSLTGAIPFEMTYDMGPDGFRGIEEMKCCSN